MNKTLLILGFLLLCGCSKVLVQEEPRVEDPKIGDTKNTGTMLVTIIVPEGLESYVKTGEYTKQKKLPDFIKKQVSVPFAVDLPRASAQAAARQIPTLGWEGHAEIESFNITDKTAYVLLKKEWCACSGDKYLNDIAYPVIEKTLLQYSEIKKVIFISPWK